ncbi:MAG: hypothetical protein V4660_09360 [Pseudomonadota bacterium]
MTTIYDLKNGTAEWCRYINSTIAEECPNYFFEAHIVGSNEWWELYESNQVHKEIQSGEVVFFGERCDWSGHLSNVVEINFNGGLIEYEVCNDWNTSYLAVGRILEVEEFSISFKGRSGPYLFKFIKKVAIKNT